MQPFRAPPAPRILYRPPRGRVLVLAPHPDDETMGLGGTLAHHAGQGDPITVVFVCSGIQGDPDRYFPPEHIVALREEEARRAAEVLGISKLRFLGYPDNLSDADIHLFEGLPAEPDEARRVLARDLAGMVVDWVLKEGYSIVYHPWEGEINADHWLVGQAARLAKDQLWSGGRPTAFLGYDVWSPSVPDIVIDTSDVMARKLLAVRCYHTQLVYMDYEHAVRGLDAYRSLFLERGATFGEGFVGDYSGSEGVPGT
jgi:LmbE family N-acetylglucosaminyl deacetylase